MRCSLASLTVAVLMVSTIRAETLLRRVTRPYDAIQSLSCEIRRDMPLASGGSARMLSRVYFQRGDRMHVDTSVPLKRRIVSDGTNFWSYIDGMAKGYGVHVAKLNDDMLGNLRSVPGSAEMALRQLADAREVPLPPTADHPVRAGFDNGKTFTVLSLDGQGRLARLEVFDSAAMSASIARTDYSAFQEVLPGVWIACIQKTLATQRGEPHAETLRVANLAVNGTLPAMLFNAEAFFTGVAFVDSFEKTDGGEK